MNTEPSHEELKKALSDSCSLLSGAVSKIRVFKNQWPISSEAYAEDAAFIKQIEASQEYYKSLCK